MTYNVFGGMLNPDQTPASPMRLAYMYAYLEELCEDDILVANASFPAVRNMRNVRENCKSIDSFSRYPS